MNKLNNFKTGVLYGVLVITPLIMLYSFYKEYYMISFLYAIPFFIAAYGFLYGLVENQEEKRYTGKVFFTFEKYPHYEGYNNKIDKVLLNLGFTKLVRRIRPTSYQQWVIDKASKIWKLGKTIPNIDEEVQKSLIDYYRLYACDKNNNYVGCLDDLIWLLKYDVKPTKNPQVYWSEKEQGYIGFSHRAAQIFKIGDKMFDEKWRPDVDELHSPELKSYALEAKKEGYSNMNDLFNKFLEQIPFNLRGRHTITNRLMAYTAAKNFARYVS